MERDDTGTFARLRSIRDEVVDPAIVSHDGRIVKTAGDGLLAEFPSALAALRASVQIQREMAKRNEGVAADDRIDYRIGVNLGDIMVDGSDIVGDGVNVASRLEALAEPGGICVSGSVREQVHGQMPVSFVDIGEQQVKNIERPIRVFRVVPNDGERQTAGLPSAMRRHALTGRRGGMVAVVAVVAVIVAGLSAWWGPKALRAWGTDSASPPAMSVGVLPLVAAAADPATAQRLDSLTRDLSAQLARADAAIRIVPATPRQVSPGSPGGVGELARALNVRYVLEGEVRPAQDVTEIRLRLVNGASGEQIWNETLSLKEPAAAADRTRSLRTAMEHLRSRLFAVEIRRVTGDPAGARTAMDYVLRAWALEDTEKSLDRQQALYEEALRRDPDLVPALLGVSSVLDRQLDIDSNVDRAQLVRRMDDVTSRVVNLNRAAPETWNARAEALMLMGRWDAALEANARAIQLDPDAAWLVANRAWAMSRVGRPAEAVTLVAQAIAMDPPGWWWTHRVGCQAHLLLGQYDEAISACEKATGLAGDEFVIARFLAAAYAHKGLTARAAEEKDKILRRSPGFTIAMLRAIQYSTHPDYMRLAEEHWYSGLRKAGIPEK